MNLEIGGTIWTYPKAYNSWAYVFTSSEVNATGFITVYNRTIASCKPAYNAASGGWTYISGGMCFAIGF